MSGAVVYLVDDQLHDCRRVEVHSPALRAWLAPRPTRSAAALVRTEVVRAVRHKGAVAVTKAQQALRDLDLIAIDDAILDAAAILDPAVLRSLDAIHLAAARTLGDDLLAIVSYDDRMIEGARLLGLPTERPGVAPIADQDGGPVG